MIYSEMDLVLSVSMQMDHVQRLSERLSMCSAALVLPILQQHNKSDQLFYAIRYLHFWHSENDKVMTEYRKSELFLMCCMILV
jgi:hypothetical protein